MRPKYAQAASLVPKEAENPAFLENRAVFRRRIRTKPPPKILK
jgi:hypothetical protein